MPLPDLGRHPDISTGKDREKQGDTRRVWPCAAHAVPELLNFSARLPRVRVGAGFGRPSINLGVGCPVGSVHQALKKQRRSCCVVVVAVVVVAVVVVIVVVL